jgi:hypothetical protein
MGLIGLRYALFPEAPVVDTPAETPAAAPGLPASR